MKRLFPSYWLFIATLFLHVNVNPHGFFNLTEKSRDIITKLQEKREKAEHTLVEKGLQTLERLNPKNKDRYATRVFKILKQVKPPLLGAMTNYYTHRFSKELEYGGLTSTETPPPHLMQEFTESVAHNFINTSPTIINYLANHHEHARPLLAQAAAENITKITDTGLISPLISDNKSEHNIHTSYTKKIVTAAKNSFSQIEPNILFALLFYNPEYRQDFVDLTAQNITKKYSRDYLERLLTDLRFGYNGFYHQFNNPICQQLLPIIKNNFENIDPVTLDVWTENNNTQFITPLTDKVLGSVDRIDTVTLENVLKNTSYRHRGKILNALRDHLNRQPSLPDNSGIKNLFNKRFGLIKLYNNYAIPWYRPALPIPHSSTQPSQTEAHLDANRALVWKTFGDIVTQPEIRDFIGKINEQEKIEEQQGRLVFFHGCQWSWDLYQDLFTKLMEIKMGKSFKDYRFLRFEREYENSYFEQRIRETLRTEGRIDQLRPKLFFMNHALFANTTNQGSSTFYYWYNNKDLSIAKMTIKEIFKLCGLEDYYTCYKREIDNLEKLHKKAQNKGTLLLVSVDPKNVSEYVYPATVGGYRTVISTSWSKKTDDVQEIISTLKQNPAALQGRSDRLEYCMILTNDYALNPEKAGTDVKIYPFHLAQDTPAYKEYCTKRDQLLQKIARDAALQQDYSYQEARHNSLLMWNHND